MPHDPARRAFFRELGRSALTTVGQVAGLADIVGRGTTAAAAGLLGVELRERPGSAPRAGSLGSRPAAGTLPRPATRPPQARVGAPADDRYRSPYRVAEDAIHVLDQRAIPDTLTELTCRRGSDVAYYLRIGACRGGPLMAQVAAYGLALTARERAERPREALDAELRRTRDALVAARPASRAVRSALDRLMAVREGLPAEADGTALAAAMRAEADAVATGMQQDLDALTDHLTALLDAAVPPPTRQELATRPLRILLHGDPGALWGGLVGPGVAAISGLRAAGREVRVVVTETRPFMEGARLAGWELRQAGIPYELIADSAVAWLLDREPVDLVLIAAEAVAGNGDVTAVVGSRGIADLVAAAAERARSVGGPAPVARLVVLAIGSVVDVDARDGRDLPEDRRPARELTSHPGAIPASGPLAALNPALDVVPAASIHALVTERGVLPPASVDAATPAR